MRLPTATPESASGSWSSDGQRASDAAPAVELQVDAREVLGFRARQVDRGVGDVACLAQPREVHALEAFAPLWRDLSIAPLVDHVTRTDRVAADSLASIVYGDGTRERVHPALARGVRGEARARPLSLPRGDVDDRA